MTESLDMSDLSTAGRRLVEAALRRGWDARNVHCRRAKREQGVLLISPSHPDVQLRIYPVQQWNDRKLQTVMNKIETYGSKR